MPDFQNEAVKATETRLGAFVFDQDEGDENRLRIDRRPHELDNGVIYLGQWT
jgi:hypothetical protein